MWLFRLEVSIRAAETTVVVMPAVVVAAAVGKARAARRITAWIVALHG